MRHISEILRRLRVRVGRTGIAAEEIDDVVQEAFARWTAYKRIHEVRAAEGFLVRTALNITRDLARRRRTAPFSSVEIDLDHRSDLRPGLDEVVQSQERLRRAGAGLDRLSDRTRRILLAHRLDGLTAREIATQEGMSVAAVEKHIARATVFLVNWMDGW